MDKGYDVMTKRLFFFVFAASVWMLSLCFTVAARPDPQDAILGKWTTCDKHGNPQSEVIIYRADGAFNCKITKLLGEFSGYDSPLCAGCPGEYEDMPLIGMDIAKGFRYENGIFKGKILSPDRAKLFRMTMEIDENDPHILIVKGYVGPFSETQKWKRVRDSKDVKDTIIK